MINVPTNIDKIQSILPRLSENVTIIGDVIKRQLQYKCPFMSGNVRPNMIMLTLKDLLSTPLFKELDVKIHHAWDCLFRIHVTIKTEENIIDDIDVVKDNFKEDVEQVSTDTMIHNFLDSDRIKTYLVGVFLLFMANKV